MLRRVVADDAEYPAVAWSRPGSSAEWIADACGQLNLRPPDQGHEDAQLLERLIDAAMSLIESHTQRAFSPGPWQLTLDRFPSCGETIEVRLSPIISIDGITYIDAAGEEQTLSSPAEYQTDITSEPARIAPAYGTTWPRTRPQLNAVTIDMTAGEGGTPALVHPAARQAILLLVGHWYSNREAVGQVGTEIALAFSSLVWSLKWTA